MALMIKNGRIAPTNTAETKQEAIINSSEISIPQTVTNFAFEISCYGLKPFTRHYFFDGNVLNEKSSLCEPAGGNKGDSLITDASGQINFKYYFTGDTVISGSSTVIPTSGSTENSTITQAIVSEGSRLFILTSSPQPSENYSLSDSSYAQFSVTISAGTGDITVNVPPTQPVFEGGGSGGAMVGEQWLMDETIVQSRKVF